MLPRRSVVALPLSWLAGCATQLEPPDGSPVPRINVQNKALTPQNGGRAIAPVDLLPGDILLSSAPGINSAGIRVLTLSPVSHAALYIGEGEIGEAVGEGVRRRGIARVIEEEKAVVAFRHPQVRDEHAQKMRAFVREAEGAKYSFVGVMMHAPFSLERRMCELPGVPALVRDFCVQGVGAIHRGVASNDRFFCSQFVLEAFRRAGLPLTDADPRLVSPADLLHMREGDVPSIRIRQALQYVGHLKLT